jgi:cell division protein FtsN
MALSSPSDAREHATLLRQRGFPASVVTLEVGGRTLYAVRVGPYATRTDAERTAATLKRQGFDAILKP